MRAVEFAPGHAQAERQLINVLWLTSGLGCDGESVAMTAATSPSLEDLVRGVLPGTPRLAIYNPLLAYESGEEFMAAFWRAAAGQLSPFVLVLEGSVPNEQLSGDGHWAAFGVDPDSGQPITTCTWIDRLAPEAAAVLALGTCAAYGGIPAMRGNPTGAMGLRDYLGAGWKSRRGVPIVNLPGCPVQPDNITETLLHLALHIAGVEEMIKLDEQGRPKRLFERTVQEGCGRAGFAEQGEFAQTPADHRGCLVKLGCMGPVVKCNVPIRGWIGGIGGCPNVGGICHACTMPGFPDKFMPFMEPNRLGLVAAAGARFTYGPLLRGLRKRAMRRHFDVEPDWRRAGDKLSTGYEPRW
jgi:hydrogenase small subunit